MLEGGLANLLLLLRDHDGPAEPDSSSSYRGCSSCSLSPSKPRLTPAEEKAIRAARGALQRLAAEETKKGSGGGGEEARSADSLLRSVLLTHSR